MFKYSAYAKNHEIEEQRNGNITTYSKWENELSNNMNSVIPFFCKNKNRDPESQTD